MPGPNPTLPVALALVSLAACADERPPEETLAEADPATVAALADPITADPDLAQQNRADSVASLPSQDGSLPTIDSGAEAVAAARAEALQLVGGPGEMRRAPDPQPLAGARPAGADLSVVARAATAPRADPGCVARGQFTMQWAARMPPAFPVYPRGAVQEAAGTDAARCSFRAVNFVTPVPLGDVIDFYYSRARAAGFSTRYVVQDGEDVLSGSRGQEAYAVYARPLASGLTVVDLVTSGG
jgi:hypothetical protein